MLVKHPARSDVHPEAVHSQPMLKYAGQPVVEQVAFYRSKGLPDPSGLWALGVMLRRHDDDNRLLGEMWLSEMRQWDGEANCQERKLGRQRVLGVFSVSGVSGHAVAII